jgi:hypothetical protein
MHNIIVACFCASPEYSHAGINSVFLFAGAVSPGHILPSSWHAKKAPEKQVAQICPGSRSWENQTLHTVTRILASYDKRGPMHEIHGSCIKPMKTFSYTC